MTHVTRRRPLTVTSALATALICALGMASCSDADGSGDGGAAATVPVTHAFGTTEVPVHPGHALSFSRTWTDAFAELGEPVATQVVNGQFSDGVPWAPEGTGGTSVAGETVPVTVTSADLVTTFGMEAVADKNPDVIFAGYLPDRETYDRLAAIAPTVATVGDGMVDDWREVTTTAGRIVDREEDAASAIAAVDRAMGGVGQRYPAVEGASFVYAAYRAKSFTVITSPADASNRFFSDLGMVSAADRVRGTESGRGKVVSAENTDMLDVDLPVLWISGETPDDLPGWSDLRAVRRGSDPQLDTVAATALGAPSVLSIPWVIDQLDPYFA
ncbi:ABC transporter substrate-binding protein, partial [uncultured Corynebacterium sp.]|uniref:ABC transporter substrate-binding protein n=1 Tax=uncultured Corynebacterium sp. TaxID=159447 RepID=UPI0025FAA2ED